MSRSGSASYISVDVVGTLVRSSRDDYLIIDVRSTDFVGGHIPGCLNLPSRLFTSSSSVQEQIEKHIIPRGKNLTTLIVHCMRSQQRGPFVAQALASHHTLPSHITVHVLDGGYRAWRKRFPGEEGMIKLDEGDKGWQDAGEWRFGEKGTGDDDEAREPEEDEHSKAIRAEQAKAGRS